jgi:radical SAM superfamily enzyme YgiQ (UPF0313 family)
MSRVFLITPARLQQEFSTPHLGCAMLSAVLKREGHEVRVVDHAFLPPEDREWDTLKALLQEFQPDLVGISVYTASVSVALDAARYVKAWKDVPVAVGGAHVTLNPEEMLAEDGVDIVVVNDGETVISAIAADPRPYRGQVVRGGQADVTALPPADFTSFHRHEKITVYPLMTSRGCPFNCSFCTVHTVTSRRWRPRELDAVLAELDRAVRTFPKLKTVEVHDDCPTTDTKRFKAFLRGLVERRFPFKLQVANIRADTVDEEMVDLLVAAGSKAICIAAEHGHPEVFNLIDKRETIEDIERAAGLIKRRGAELRLCFVIGLPGDNPERMQESIRLAVKYRPRIIYWNMAHPFKHTRIRQWYLENGGTILDDADYGSYTEPKLEPAEPIVWTEDFTREERKRAYFQAVVETDQYRLKREGFRKLFRLARHYKCRGAAFRSALRHLFHVTRR